jgi:hypothetical protein
MEKYCNNGQNIDTRLHNMILLTFSMNVNFRDCKEKNQAEGFN